MVKGESIVSYRGYKKWAAKDTKTSSRPIYKQRDDEDLSLRFIQGGSVSGKEGT